MPAVVEGRTTWSLAGANLDGVGCSGAGGGGARGRGGAYNSAARRIKQPRRRPCTDAAGLSPSRAGQGERRGEW
eukprot:scaffold199535_cov26-Tisochrysis_lutea.AAC.7